MRRIPSYSWPCPKMLPASRGFPVQRWPSPMFPSMADKWLKRRCLRRDSRRRPVACLRLPAAYWCLRWACRRRKNRGRDCRHRSRRQEWRPQAESEASVSWISSAARFADYSRNSGVHAPHGSPGVVSRFQPLVPATGSGSWLHHHLVRITFGIDWGAGGYRLRGCFKHRPIEPDPGNAGEGRPDDFQTDLRRTGPSLEFPQPGGG